jgi:hypothetical protein
VGVREGVVVGV